LAETTTVIFDLDGTLVDTERDGHRTAFNAAFEQHGLPYRWDETGYGRLLKTTGGRRRIQQFLDECEHPGDRASLASALHTTKTARFRDWVVTADVQARAGVETFIADLDAAGVTLAVCTTGTAEWVYPLLERVFGLERFHTIVTGDDVVELKPEPDAYLLALARLGIRPEHAVAVEDSDNGLIAARRAGLRCVVVTNAYTVDQNFDGALGVYQRFTTGPHALNASGLLSARTRSPRRVGWGRAERLR
jgi:HAD superfamily hydrolase (TIGR01509 family)